MSKPTKLTDAERAVALDTYEQMRGFLAERSKARRELTKVGAALLVALHEEQTERIGALEEAVEEAARELNTGRTLLPSEAPVDEEAEDASERISAWNDAHVALRAAQDVLAKVTKGGR